MGQSCLEIHGLHRIVGCGREYQERFRPILRQHGSKPDQSVFSIADIVSLGSKYIWVRRRLYAGQYLAERIATNRIGVGVYSAKPVDGSTQLEVRHNRATLLAKRLSVHECTV